MKRISLALCLWCAIVGCKKAAPPSPTEQGTFVEAERVDPSKTPVDLYVQFGEATITGAVDNSGKPVSKIWTRAYGLAPDKPMVPGPTLVFRPGDTISVTLHNLLDPELYPELKDFDTSVTPVLDTDDIIEQIGHEINLPHNPNNTNLHVHGLHVDPSIDDVTLIVTPKSDDPSNYSPMLQDKIKVGSWKYQYRIPDDHLPGTHWFHAHKHGSTSVHVENGMAGTLLIQPKDPKDAIVVGLDPKRDRVMVIQEIANYGVQQGGGITAVDSDKFAGSTPDITINGKHQPTLVLAPGQVERWRFVNAGSNHRAFSYLWLDGVTMYLVAIDGITLKAKVPITKATPLFLGPGNRADVVLKIPADADATKSYALYKNGEAGTTTGPLGNAISDPYVLGTDFAGHVIPWKSAAPKQPGGSLFGNTSIAPLLRGVKDGELLYVQHPVSLDDGHWQPVITQGGGLIDGQLLLRVKLSGAANPDEPELPSDAQLSKLSPTGTMATIPAYVAPFSESTPIHKRRVVVFDKSGAQYTYTAKDGSTGKINQFSINGRLFSLVDNVGNINGEVYMTSTPFEDWTVGEMVLDAAKLWRNTYWTNPGYTAPLTQVVEGEKSYYTYDYEQQQPLGFETVTGIPNPGPPTAQTAEEWVLINNSDIGHPFHIHINPFLVTEVGQLSYDATAKTWSTKTLAPSDPLGYVLNNWWDTIIILPHGYVRFKMWINVPQQNPDATVVDDNVNRIGAWVFHCHILRHEDRGMMIMVRTELNGN